MKRTILIPPILVALLAGCGKTGDVHAPATAYRQACAGDPSLKCRAMMMDVEIARLQAAMADARQSEDGFVACRGQAAFDEGMALFEEKIAFYRKLKPNVFMRSVLSDMQIGFKQPAFKHERQFAAFTAALAQCRKGASTVPAQAGPAGPQPPRP